MALTTERLHDILHYNPETGIFTWLKKPSLFSNVKVGGVAGCVKPRGYVDVSLDGITYPCHRLAWFYTTGMWPNHHIDHKNLNKSDNRLENLRQVTSAQNSWNTPVLSSNTSGLKGTRWYKASKKWGASIMTNGVNINLGTFECPAAAHFSYVVAADKYHGEFARV
jgi:hypothetical protein